LLTIIAILMAVGLSIVLFRNIKKESDQRTQIAKLNVKLEALLKQRESLVHLVTHKVKGAFTRSKYIFAGILDGTFGPITPEIKKYAEQGLESDDSGINTVDLVLNVANMQKGVIKYDMKKIDFKSIVENSISEKKVPAERKGLQIEKEIKDDDYSVSGDIFWLKEAVNNLLENSLKYTKQGKITVSLKKEPASTQGGNGKIKLYIKDTGVGITEEDKKNLFTEGGRGKDSVKVNVDSTGYGLYTVKLIIGAHGGKVAAESEGADKGSTFSVELNAIS
jgi:signal transduction histidine kinase